MENLYVLATDGKIAGFSVPEKNDFTVIARHVRHPLQDPSSRDPMITLLSPGYCSSALRPEYKLPRGVYCYVDEEASLRQECRIKNPFFKSGTMEVFGNAVLVKEVGDDEIYMPFTLDFRPSGTIGVLSRTDPRTGHVTLFMTMDGINEILLRKEQLSAEEISALKEECNVIQARESAHSGKPVVMKRPPCLL